MRRDGRTKTAPHVETFIPKVSFTGYPDGETATRFVVGVESAPVPVDYVALLRAKGLVAVPPPAKTVDGETRLA